MSRLYAAAEMRRAVQAGTERYPLATLLKVQGEPLAALANMPNHVHKSEKVSSISNGQQSVLRLWCCWAQGEQASMT